MYRLLYIPIFLPLLLGACTAQQAAVVNLGLEKVKATNDTTAQVLIQSTCGMTLGAYHRLESPTDKQGADLLCGGTWDPPITLQDLQRFLDAR